MVQGQTVIARHVTYHGHDMPWFPYVLLVTGGEKVVPSDIDG